MSYEATMQFLRTGVSDLPGTEDPRYAGGFSVRPPFAGQTQRHGSAKGWRLTPDAHRDYSSTVRVPGAPPIAGADGAWRLTPGAYHDYDSTARVWGAPPLAGGHTQYEGACSKNVCGGQPPFNKPADQGPMNDWIDCMNWCEKISIEMQGGTPSQPRPHVRVSRPKKKAVLRPVRRARARARFAVVAGKSRADAVRLGFAGGCGPCGRP